MAIKLENKVNTEAPSVAYPFGNIKDNTGSNNGTPVDKNVYADFHQFFAKMMAESGIAYNDLPDNNTDGFQYWLALVEAIKNNCNNYVAVTGITAGSGITIDAITAREYADGTITICAIITATTNISANSNLITGIPSANPNSFSCYAVSGATKFNLNLYAVIGVINNPFGAITSGTNITFDLTYKKV